MKKILFILIAVISFGAVSAQSRNYSNRRDNGFQQRQVNDNGFYNVPSSDEGYNSGSYQRDDHDRIRSQMYTGRGSDDNFGPEDRQSIQGWQEDNFHQGEGSYDNGYHNDRIRSGDRNSAGMERRWGTPESGTGAMAGGVAGFILGTLLNHR